MGLSTSAWGMHFKPMRNFTLCIIAAILLVIISGQAFAEMIDRVVVYIDDQAITYSEFKVRYAKLKTAVPGITQEEALNSMINSLLLLDRARKMRLEALTEDDLIKEYLDIVIKARIVIGEDRLIEYFNLNKKDFGEKTFVAVRNEIEKYLTELEVNKRLKEHLEILKKETPPVVQFRY